METADQANEPYIGIYNPSSLSATVVGVGGIGSQTAFLLAKAGVPYLQLVDGDTVEIVNTQTQLYSSSDIGRPKVSALAEKIYVETEVVCEVACQYIDVEHELRDLIVISALDSIRARKDVWSAVVRGDVGHYFDARMGAEEVHLFYVDMSSPEAVGEYSRTLQGHSDEGIADLPCTQRATYYTGSLIAALIGKQVAKIAQRRPVEKRMLINFEPFHMMVIP